MLSSVFSCLETLMKHSHSFFNQAIIIACCYVKNSIYIVLTTDADSWLCCRWWYQTSSKLARRQLWWSHRPKRLPYGCQILSLRLVGKLRKRLLLISKKCINNLLLPRWCKVHKILVIQHILFCMLSQFFKTESLLLKVWISKHSKESVVSISLLQFVLLMPNFWWFQPKTFNIHVTQESFSVCMSYIHLILFRTL